MTVVVGSTRPAAPQIANPAPLMDSVPAMLLVGGLLALLMNFQTLLSVWQTNRFLDSDDAMQLVQLRDWMAGQGWFDNLQRRMDPPTGVAMHWTHVAELPMALLMRMFSPFVGQDAAERMMRIVYPLLFQVGFAATAVLIARKLLPAEARAGAVLLALISMTSLSQFQPGRITHNAAQVVLLMLMVHATLGIFAARPARLAALTAGLLAAVSLAVSLENLPFIAGMAIVYGVAFVACGTAAAMAWFGGGAALGAAAAFLAVVPPERFFLSACDAFSAAHLIAAVVGGTGFMIVGIVGRHEASMLRRSAGLAAVGIATAAAVAMSYPECIGDPFSAVDKVVRAMWMGGVSEAQPMLSVLLHDPLGSLSVIMPVVLGFIATATAAVFSAGPARARWIVVLAFAAVGIVTACWQVRALTYTAALTVFGAGWAVARVTAAVAARPRAWTALTPIVLLSFVPSIWALAALGKPVEDTPHGDASACWASSSIEALNALPPSLLASTIDPGPFVLALTHHTVLTGPYHRDNRGLRASLDVALADPLGARAKLQATKAAYFFFCPASAEADWYASHKPDGFLARLRSGDVPAWLHPVTVAGTPYRVYRVE